MNIALDSQSPKLFSLLASIPGKKSLVLDQSLSVLISSLASFTQLQDHGIESVKWLSQTHALESGPSRVLLIARPDADTIRKAASVVKQTRGKEFTLLLVPRRTLESDEILEREGILSEVDIKVLPITYTQEEHDFIRVDVPPKPYSDGIISPAEIYQVAHTLSQLQHEFGQFARIRGKGAKVPALTHVLAQLQADVRIEDKVTPEESGILDDCIILDRTTDMMTPLLTQLTYEGLLRETYSVSGTVLDLPTQITATDRKIQLAAEDSIFASLRGENFRRVGPSLSAMASQLSHELDARHGLKTTSQLKQFVSRMPNLQSSQKLLKVHIELTELLLAKTQSRSFRAILDLQQSLYGGFAEAEVMAEMESLIALKTALPVVLSLLGLWSCTHNGLKQKDHEFFAMRMVQAYGDAVMDTLHRLSRAGLWLIRSPATERGRGGWTGFSRTWNLCPDDFDEALDEPQDIAYLYSGFAPLNLRILEGYLGVATKEEKPSVLSVVGGGGGGGSNSLSSKQRFESALANLRGPSVDIKAVQSGGDKVTVVVFLGGCCAAEVAGVRFIMKKLGRQCCIVTGATMHSGDWMQHFTNG